jgi:hypothetical protein
VARMSLLAKARIQLVVAMLLSSPLSRAANERATASLEWNRSIAAADCLEAPAFAAMVEGVAHRTVFVSAFQADLRIRVNLDRPDQEQWSAAITLEDRNGKKLGHRELAVRAPQCSAINDSLALVVSLMVDVTRESVRPQPVLVQPTPPIEGNFAQQAPASSSANAQHAGLMLLGSTRIGQLPGLGRGITMAGDWGPNRSWYVLVSATLWFPAQMSDENSGARLWLGTDGSGQGGGLPDSNGVLPATCGTPARCRGGCEVRTRGKA